MSITSTLFPPAYRMAALVAFLRTFWQVIRPPLALGGLGLGTLAATGVLPHTNLKVLAVIAAATVLSALLSGALAAGDILKNGLPNAYANAAVASIPAAVVTPAAIPAPVDPSQPAAGTPPSFQDIINAPATPVLPPALFAAPPAIPAAAPAAVAGPVVTPAPAAPFVATSDALPPVTA